MFLECGTLPLGVSHGGRRCREFSLRPAKVKDAIAVRESPDFQRCKDNADLFGLALMAQRLTIDGVPADAMTLELMGEMWDADMEEIQAADGRLEEEMARFRGEDPEATDPGVAAPERAVGGGDGDAGSRGPGMAGGLGGDPQPGEDGREAEGAAAAEDPG